MRNKRLIILLSVVAALVVLIIAGCATFLVRDVEAYGYYENAPDYDDKVIAAAGIKKNSSMFFIKDSAVKSKIENAYFNVEVINIERKFPDRVSINYIVHDNAFQYLSGNTYYQCYSSGRIGSSSDTEQFGFFTIKPSAAVATTLGAYFQNAEGYDRVLTEKFIGYMRTTGKSDWQIADSVRFVDFTRSGYVFIRTAAGCGVEVRGTGDEFTELLDKGWSAFMKSGSLGISQVSGVIRVGLGADGEPNVVYSPDDGYYEKYYGGADGETNRSDTGYFISVT